MARSMGLFRKAGFLAIAFPTDYRSLGSCTRFSSGGLRGPFAGAVSERVTVRRVGFCEGMPALNRAWMPWQGG